MRIVVPGLAAIALAVAAFAMPADAARSWSERFGSLSPGASVTIAAGEVVAIDVCDIELGSVVVEGVLTVDRELPATCPQATLRLATILVHGESAEFRVGSETDPYDGRFEIVLTGRVDGTAPGMAEQRQILIMDGATMALHGVSGKRRSWTQLAGHAAAGADRIRVAHRTRWQPGDRIVVAASGIDPREAEVVTVTSADDGGRALGIDPPLQFDRFGLRQYYAGKELDSRAEVGLLSHSIVIRGDETSETTGIGGNVMVMNAGMRRPEGHPAELLRPSFDGPASTLIVDGVELVHMGQRGRAGRYPLHWHLVDDGSSSHVRDTSIHHGFQRAVNIHGTDRVTVERVVAYHVENHMFVVSEEGDEVHNRLIDNLGILALPPLDDRFAFPDENNSSRSDQSEHRHAVFWMRTSFNTLAGNHAAGSWLGQGFFYDHGGFNGRSRRYAFEASDTLEMCDFRDNLAHSIYMPLRSPDWYTPLVSGFGVFSSGHQYRDESTTCTMTGFVAYKTQNGGAWLEEHTVLEHAVIADSHTGVIAGDRLHDVVVVGQTMNDLASGGLPGKDPRSHPDRSRGGFAQSNNGGQRIGGRHFTSLTCIGLPTCFFVQTGRDDRIGQFDGAHIDDVRVVATPQGFSTVDDPVVFDDPMSIRFGSFLDVDGGLTGVAGAAGSIDDPVFLATPRHPVNRWGWYWDTLAATPGDGPELFSDGFE